jgi:hypothetical protein
MKLGSGRAKTRSALVIVIGLLTLRCDEIQDRFRTCGHLQVDLINDDQSISPISILAEDEQPFPEAILASGASRRRLLCVERGDAKNFRAIRGGDTIAVANCVVSRARYEYESTVSRVVWDPRGLGCENW